MPKIIRPRHEFPTPLFRAFVAVAAPLLGGLPGWVFMPRWDSAGGYLAVLGLGCVVVAPLVGTARQLLRAAAFGALAVLALCFVEYVVHAYSQLD